MAVLSGRLRSVSAHHHAGQVLGYRNADSTEVTEMTAYGTSFPFPLAPAEVG